MMDAKEEHDHQLSKRKSLAGSRYKLDKLFRDKKLPSQAESQSERLDPISAAVKNNPGLTREKAAEIAEKFGF